MLGRVTTYLSFLEHARCPVRGFHNFLSYQRDWLDAEGTGDSQGQAVRALAEVLGSSLPDGYRALARELIDAVTPALADLRSLRAQAYVILAWGHLSMSGVKDFEAGRERRPIRGRAAGGVLPPFPTAGLAVVRVADDLRERRVAPCPVHCRPVLAGGGFSRRGGSIVRLLGPRDHRRGLLLAGRKQRLVPPRRRKIAVRSAAGGGRHHGRAALAGLALLGDAGDVGDEKYLAAFRRAHAWFHGRNSLHQPLVDVHCGSCYDGLQRSGVNRNQGAESTLAYLWAELNNKDNSTCVENRKPPIRTRSCSIATATTPS